MPKEITHWIIAERAVERLAGDSLLGSSARQAMNTMRLGAIFHDVLYYLTDIPARHPARQVPDTLHGVMGGDTYKIARAIADVYYHHRDMPQLLAFLAGVVSHIQADIVFHPMVYYTSGNPFDRATKSAATRHHRVLESVIDMLVCAPSYRVESFHVGQYLKSAEVDMRMLWTLLYQGFTTVPEQTLADFTVRAYRRLALIRRFEVSPVVNALHRTVRSFLPTSLREVMCLAYDQHVYASAQRQGIDRTSIITYRHPVSNQEFAQSIDDLIEEAIQKTVDICVLIDRELKDFAPILDYERGASLETGMIGTKIRQMMYFRSTPLLELY